jgi:CrcB protein
MRGERPMLAALSRLESTGATERLQPHPNWRLFLVVGVLGGYTTFSSFEYEIYQAVRDGARWMGMLYMTGSVVLGYAGVWLGAVLTVRR